MQLGNRLLMTSMEHELNNIFIDWQLELLGPVQTVGEMAPLNS